MKLQANLTIAAAILTPSNNHLPTPSKLPSRHLLPATGMRDPFVKADSSPVKLAQVSTPKIAGYALLKSIDKLIDFAFSAISLPGADALVLDVSASRMEDASYTKGDEARSVEDFSYQLRDEFVVFANKKAHEPENFTKNSIFIYGANHVNPMIPSLRTEPGLFLMENPYGDYCLDKHKQHPGNICKNIDLVDNSELIEAHLSFIHSAMDLIQRLDVAEHNMLTKMINKQGNTQISINALNVHMLDFLKKQYTKIHAKQTPQVQKELESLASKAHFYDRKIEALSIRIMDTRDRGMIREAKKWINAKDEGVATTILVGGFHVRAIANALEQAYPDRALVVCVLNDDLKRTTLYSNINLEIVPPLPPKKPDGEL